MGKFHQKANENVRGKLKKHNTNLENKGLNMRPRGHMENLVVNPHST